MVNIRKLEAELWESADLLRAGSKLTSNQYCMPVLGLIFLRYAYSRFKMVETEILKDRPVRGGRVLPVEASDFASKSALFLPREAQYEYLVNLPAGIVSAGLVNQSGHIMNSLGEVVNNAMELVEAQSEQLTGVLPKDYTIFSDELLAELLRIFNNSALDEVGGDVIGRIYEYFLNKFAKNIAQDDGVFFTPKSLVKMIVNVLEPSGGILLDPACGSGGMFVQTGDFVNHAGMNANSTMTFYGQEKVEYNAQLCLMNMAVHGLAGVIKSGDEANTFYHDAHNLNGCCDYVMANPPFNVDKVNAESTQSAGRLPFGMPSVNAKKEVGNGNYLWISYFHSYLNEHGRAGFVMASSATDSSGKDRDIRQKLVETGHVDVMVSVGNNFFYTKSLPCSLWFFDKGKREELQDKVLFIDARNYYTVVDRTLNEWSDWQLKNLNAIVWLYRGEPEKYHKLLKEYYAEISALLAELDDICRDIPVYTDDIYADMIQHVQAFSAKVSWIKVQIPLDMPTPCCTVRLRQRHLLDLIGFQFPKDIDLPQKIRCGDFSFEIPPSGLDRCHDPFLIAGIAHRLQPIPLVWRSVLITVPPFFHSMPQSIVYPQCLVQRRTVFTFELRPQHLAEQSVDHTVAVVRFRRGFRNEILPAALTPCDTLFLLAEIKLQFQQVQLKDIFNRIPQPVSERHRPARKALVHQRGVCLLQRSIPFPLRGALIIGKTDLQQIPNTQLRPAWLVQRLKNCGTFLGRENGRTSVLHCHCVPKMFRGIKSGYGIDPLDPIRQVADLFFKILIVRIRNLHAFQKQRVLRPEPLDHSMVFRKIQRSKPNKFLRWRSAPEFFYMPILANQ